MLHFFYWSMDTCWCTLASKGTNNIVSVVHIFCSDFTQNLSLFKTPTLIYLFLLKAPNYLIHELWSERCRENPNRTKVTHFLFFFSPYSNEYAQGDAWMRPIRLYFGACKLCPLASCPLFPFSPLWNLLVTCSKM